MAIEVIRRTPEQIAGEEYLSTWGRPNSRVTNRHLEGHSAEFGEKQYVKDLESF